LITNCGRHKGSEKYLLGREKQEVFPAAAMDGFTAARQMFSLPAPWNIGVEQLR
jgi:hypothetical protein